MDAWIYNTWGYKELKYHRSIEFFRLEKTYKVIESKVWPSPPLSDRTRDKVAASGRTKKDHGHYGMVHGRWWEKKCILTTAEKRGQGQNMTAKESNVRIGSKKWGLVELRGVINELVRGGKKEREENTFISKVRICTSTWWSPQKQ